MQNDRPKLSLWVQTAWIHALIATAVVTLVGLISIFTGRYLLREMEKIETVEMARDVNRLRMGLNYEARDLDTTCRDWASWHDLYRFASDRNAAFIAENLYDFALHDTLDLDLFALFDRDGKLVWGRRWLPGAKPDGAVEALSLGSLGANPFPGGPHAALHQGMAGIRLTPAGPMVLAIRPVREGADAALSSGTLIMGRLLHARRKAWLEQRTGLRFQLRDSRRSAFTIPEQERIRELDRAPFAVEAQERTATIHLRMPDLAGEGFLLASIAWPREQMMQGKNAIATVVFSLFVSILLMLLALGTMLRTQTRMLEQNRQALLRQVRERTADLEQSRQEALALLEDANQQRRRLERTLAELKSTAAALRESEDRYRSLFERSRDAMFLYHTTAGVFTACNAAAVELFGAARAEELLSQSPASLSPPTQPNGRPSKDLADEITAVAVREGSHFFEWDFRTRTGGIFTAMVMLSRFEAERQYLLATIRDITAQKRLEAEREKQFMRQEKLAEMAMAFLSIEQTDRAIDQALEKAGRHLGAGRAYVIADNPKERIWSNTHEWCRDGVQPLIDRLAAVPYEFAPSWRALITAGDCLAVRDIRELPPDVSEELARQSVRSFLCVPYKAAGEFTGFIGFDDCEAYRAWEPSDIHFAQTLAGLIGSVCERQELNKSLVRARDAAEAANRAKSVFLANMSHEIRTPLNVILGYAQLLRRDPDLTPREAESVETIARSGERLLRMLSDILEMSRIEAGSLVRRMNLFDFHELLHDLEETHRLRATGKKLAFHWESGPGLPRLLRGDDAKIRQALDHLLDNAVKFTDQGSVSVRISLVGTGSPCRLAVDVADTGRGIAPDDLAQLFEPFGQSLRPVGLNEGSGLGLAISRQFARLMDGDLTVTSEPGRGSVFRLVFEAQPVAAEEAEQGGRTGVDLRPVLGPAPGQRVRQILVVDDRATSRQVLAHLLESIGFRVLQASEGREALTLFESKKPDAVLMDRRMPEMDGLAVLRRMKALRPQTPVLIVTAGGLEDDRAEALAAGADGYLSKPYSEGELFEAIRRATGVVYVHAEAAPIAETKLDSVPEPDAAAFRVLPTEWREALRLAAETGDIEQLGELADQASAVHSALGARLRALVEVFDYEAILKLLG